MDTGLISRFAAALLGRFRGVCATRREDDEAGQGMVEYALILVLIAIVVIAVVAILGNQVSNVYSNVSSGLNG
jgi:pilus assembly protein Flp/PilA